MSDSEKCEVCGTASSLRCSFCRLVYYCSSKHQKKDWKRHKPSCTQHKFKVDKDEHVGRHLLATEPLKADQILLKEKAILIGPKLGNCNSDVEGQGQISSTPLFCLGCYKDLLDAEAEDPECRHCQLPICCEACSNEQWHKNFECRFFTESKSLNETTIVSPGEELAEGLSEDIKVYNKVTVIQSLLYFRSVLLKFFCAEAYETLVSLESNAASREDLPSLEKTTRVYEDFKKLIAQTPHSLVTSISKPEVHQLIGIIDTNGAEIQIRGNCTLIGIYPTYSMFEHSCIPNTRIYFMPKSPMTLNSIDIYARAVCKIEPGEHITTTYTNLLWNTDKRREDLKKRKYFTCACPRCSDPTEFGSNFSTIRCPAADCSGFSVPLPKIGDAVVWQCQKCNKTTETWQVSKVDKRLAEMVSRLQPVVDSYREMLRAMEDLVHPNYYLNFIVNHSLIQLFGKDEVTRNDKIVLDEKIKICNQLLGVLKIIDPGLGCLHLYAAVIYYEMQSAILALAGGEGDDDFKILRANPESVKLARIYLQKSINCFQYEFFQLPENKLKVLTEKKMEYLNMVVKHFKK